MIKGQILNWCPIVQVAGVSTVEEALFCHECGVNSVGFTLELPHGLHDDLNVEKTKCIIRDLPSDLLPVIITYLNRADAAIELLCKTGGRAIQFHGEISDHEIQRFREHLPHVMSIGRITVNGDSSLQHVPRFQSPLWDAIILDSLDPVTGRIGATGKTHDWRLSAEIVRIASVPVILAGGLSPENVREAVLTVRPHGVDVHTGVENPDGSRNFDKIRRFASQALTAFRDISVC
ncbi:phosphoribosylanthranilate isomerase [Desulfomonile tiedjei]|uniref:N-(5'-phosphoribosyl)anthranilate isomerase n=1 Tax=Desulfomonile tiedjei (strain ATCC 49306 / DSM 6799 / DCB-1) TaxID=706587 RepID=I4CA34_DESTA|nr:phosphoribosylanthranilate isomerase [Desulfomonile tiedjei]AFM26425.1 phosphoribosylanthranilate isomerase [Desulfomonile tiedjei DSM 6799]